ncbi:unnamed protein product [Effrenium voratum]|nr:unnamed protein product [Effrenium voratum]
MAPCGDSLWNLWEVEALQVEDALLRLKRQLALQPPLLDQAVAAARRLRQRAESFKDWAWASLAAKDQSLQKAGYSALRPQVAEKRVSQLEDELAQLQDAAAAQEQRELDMLQSLQRAKSRNGQLLIQMQNLRDELEHLQQQHTIDDDNTYAKLQNMQNQLHAAWDRATEAENKCDTLGKKLAEARIHVHTERSVSHEGDEELAESLTDMQEQLEAARDRATDAEMECDSLRKQLEKAQARPAAAGSPVSVGDEDPAERMAEMQEQLEAARDRARDAELECNSLRKQLEKAQARPAAAGSPVSVGDEDPAERMAEMQEQLEAARDRATDAEMECDSLRKQLEKAQAQPTAAGSPTSVGDEDLAERLADMQEQLEAARDRATDAEMECDSLRKQLEKAQAQPTAAGSPTSVGDEDPAERLADMQEQLEAARDRATDAEMECDSLRKQLEKAQAQPTAAGSPTSVGDEDLAERLADMQEQLEAARDRATDADMECDSLRKQLEKAQAQPTAAGSPTSAGDEDLAQMLAGMQEQMEAARDRATDAEMQCRSLKTQLLAICETTSSELHHSFGLQGKTERELDLEHRIAQLLEDLKRF